MAGTRAADAADASGDVIARVSSVKSLSAATDCAMMAAGSDMVERCGDCVLKTEGIKWRVACVAVSAVDALHDGAKGSGGSLFRPRSAGPTQTTEAHGQIGGTKGSNATSLAWSRHLNVT